MQASEIASEIKRYFTYMGTVRTNDEWILCQLLLLLSSDFKEAFKIHALDISS